MKKFLSIALCLLSFSLLAEEEPTFYSNAFYRAEFRSSPNTRFVEISFGGKKMLFGERLETRMSMLAATAQKPISHAFEKLPDGLKYVYERELVLRNTNTVVGVGRFTFLFKPDSVRYEVTATPRQAYDVGHVNGCIFTALVWPLNPEAFQGYAVHKELLDGTGLQNTIDYSVTDFDAKKWGVGGVTAAKVTFATERDTLVFTPDARPCTLEFGRYGGKNGKTLEFDLNVGKPPTATGWSFVWDKPITFGLTVDLAAYGSGEASDTFRMVSYNIRHGENMDRRLALEDTARVIAAQRPRFVGVQEVDQGTARTKGADTCAALAKGTGLVATFAKAIDFDGGEYGNAVLSREKPLSVRRVPLPGGEKRVLLLCEFADCWFGTMHLAVDSAEARAASVALVREAVAACGQKPVFLSGDWNASPDSAVLKDLKTFVTVLSPENRATYHPGMKADDETPNHRRCIDYLTVDPAHAAQYEVVRREVIDDRKTSDHRPVVVELRKTAAR